MKKRLWLHLRKYFSEGGTEKNQENPRSEQPTPGSIYEPENFHMKLNFIPLDRSLPQTISLRGRNVFLWEPPSINRRESSSYCKHLSDYSRSLKYSIRYYKNDTFFENCSTLHLASEEYYRFKINGLCTAQATLHKMEFALFLHITKTRCIQWLDTIYPSVDLIYFL